MNLADRHHDRGLLLYQQRRYADAERELRAGLALDPHDPRLHALLGLALARQDKLTDASAEADAAVGLGPDVPFSHYVRAVVLHMRHRYDEALPAVEQAIALDPYDAGSRWLLGAIRFDRQDWAGALASADAGLEIDPEDDGCTNLRAMALVKLGRKAEAGDAIDAALAKNPDNAVTHANRGWTLLHQGEHVKAMEHFREALRLNPELDWARAGIVESLKARHLVYRLMLRYFLWVSNFGSRAQWAIMIGGYIGYQALSSVARTTPAVAPFVAPILVAYVAFAMMTWLADPLFNLMLRASKFGRLALSKRQTWASNVLAMLLALAVTSAVAGFAAGGVGSDDADGGGFPYFVLAIAFGMLTVPAMGCFRLSPGWPTWAMVAGTAVLAVIGLTAAGMAFVVDRSTDDTLRRQMASGLPDVTRVFTFGFLGLQFGYNALRGVEPKR